MLDPDGPTEQPPQSIAGLVLATGLRPQSDRVYVATIRVDDEEADGGFATGVGVGRLENRECSDQRGLVGDIRSPTEIVHYPICAVEWREWP